MPSIRNEPLRQTLSGHETQFIADGLARATRSVKVLAILLLISICGFIGPIAFHERRDLASNPIQSEEKIVDGRVTYVDKRDPAMMRSLLVGGIFVLSTIVGFVALLKLFFAVFEVLKFRSYRDDHEKFLRHYRRKS